MAAPRSFARQYAREIVVVLVVKFVALAVIWSVWFSDPARKHIDGERVAERIYSPESPASTQREPHAARP